MFDRKLCPDCAGKLGVKATKCRCGWQAVSAVMEEVRINAHAEAIRKAEEERAERWVVEREKLCEQGMVSVEDFIKNARYKAKLRGPEPDALAHWRKVLASPTACFAAKEMAREVVARLERLRAPAVGREPGSDDE
jgi:hypothetical protein